MAKSKPVLKGVLIGVGVLVGYFGLYVLMAISFVWINLLKKWFGL